MKKSTLLTSMVVLMLIQGYNNESSARRPFSQAITKEARAIVAEDPSASVDTTKATTFLARADVQDALTDKIHRRAQKMARGEFDSTRSRGSASIKIAEASRRVANGSLTRATAKSEANRLVADADFTDAIREKMDRRVKKIKTGTYTKA